MKNAFICINEHSPWSRKGYDNPFRMHIILKEIFITKAWLKRNQNESIISSFSYSEEEEDKDWLFILKGPLGTPYEGGEYKIMVSFPKDFPSSKYSIDLQFATPLPYACHVYQTDHEKHEKKAGFVCHNIMTLEPPPSSRYNSRSSRGKDLAIYLGKQSVAEIVEVVAHTVFCRGIHAPDSGTLPPYLPQIE